jgi:Ulp1 protease family, C-terminal catalytic domain
VGTLTPWALLEFSARNWLSCTTLSAGIDVIRQQNADALSRVAVLPTYFWQGILITNQTGTLCQSLAPYLEEIRLSIGKTLQDICFPLCSGNHWFMINISLKKKEIQIADGYGGGIDFPEDLHSILTSFLRRNLEVDLTDWNTMVVRLAAPQQMDGDSCGLIVLELLEQVCTATAPSWTQDLAVQCRKKWLVRCIELWRKASEELMAKETQAAGEVNPFLHFCQCN